LDVTAIEPSFRYCLPRDVWGGIMGEVAVVVVPDHVLETGRFVREVSTELKSGLESLTREVQHLLTTWNGRAADRYEAGWLVVQQGAHEILDALADMSELLSGTAEGYRDRELDNAKQTSLLRGLL
jgi:WXG100 family type VII secretion target